MQTADDHDGQLRGRPSSSSRMQTADDHDDDDDADDDEPFTEGLSLEPLIRAMPSGRHASYKCGLIKPKQPSPKLS